MLLSPLRRPLLVAPPYGGAALHPRNGLFDRGATGGSAAPGASDRGGGPGVGGPAVYGSGGPADRLQPPAVPGALLLLRLVDRRLPLLHVALRPLLPPVSHGSIAPRPLRRREGKEEGWGVHCLTPPSIPTDPLDLCQDSSRLPLTVTDHISSWFQTSSASTTDDSVNSERFTAMATPPPP